MAEAMCGPSNALQQFKQQTDIDRTLQQERLTSRPSPAQGFRSHNPNAGLLDPEFEAFQAGLQPPVLDHGLPFQRPGGFGSPSQPPSWANDFQRLQISPLPMQHEPQFQQASNTSNWAHGFREQFAQSAPRAQNSSSSPLAFQQRARGYGGLGLPSHFAQSSYAAPSVQSKGKEPVMADQFDEAAFERAFDLAREDMMTDVEETTQQEESVEELVEKIEAAAEQDATQMLNESSMDLESQSALHRSYGPDVEHVFEQVSQEEERTEERQQQDDDALAATAQELLEKVEHNKSDKFRNSQFLGLMRKLRDREMRVEGDKMVETTNASSTSIADDTLNASSTTNTNANRVYHGKPPPVPLQAPVDTRPSDYAIPPNEQDHDAGRMIDPRDGQEVVDLLNGPGPITEDVAPNTSLPDMLYGPGGPLSGAP